MWQTSDRLLARPLNFRMDSLSRRLRASESFLSNLTSMDSNSIILASLRRSSLGLHKKGYWRPSSPITVSLRGFCNDAMIWIASSKPELRHIYAIQPRGQRGQGGQRRIQLTMEADLMVREWLVRCRLGRY